MIKDKTIVKMLDFIRDNQPTKASNIALGLELSRTIIHKYLIFALEKGLISKHGIAPHVRYTTKEQNLELPTPKDILEYNDELFLNQRFLVYDVNGRELYGYTGFISWCKIRGYNVKEQYKSFVEITNKINSLRDKCGLIDRGFEKFKKQVKQAYIDNLYYLDVYQLAQFGKSKLGSMAFYAKQSQSPKLIKDLCEQTNNQIRCHISKNKYDAICFIPHSLKRPIQLIDSLRKSWNITLPEIKLKKLYSGTVIIPQKSIKGVEQRIRNARETIYVLPGQTKFKNILLIDDFVGSGATLNESARKIKESGLARHITGLALVGNIDLSYEVINEV